MKTAIFPSFNSVRTIQPASRTCVRVDVGSLRCSTLASQRLNRVDDWPRHRLTISIVLWITIIDNNCELIKDSGPTYYSTSSTTTTRSTRSTTSGKNNAADTYE